MVVKQTLLLGMFFVLMAGVQLEGSSRAYCESNDLDYNPGKKECCPYGQRYDTAVKVCCPAALYNESKRSCCPSGYKYHPQIKSCCNIGMIIHRGACCWPDHINKITGECCEGQYNPITKKCCPFWFNGRCCSKTPHGPCQ